jgi:Zn-dependent protease with chaperone function
VRSGPTCFRVALAVAAWSAGALLAAFGFAADALGAHAVTPPGTTVAFGLLASTGALLVSGVVSGARTVLREVSAHRRLLRAARDLPHLPEAPADVIIVPSVALHAFCAGLLRPRVFVSTRTMQVLSAEELRVVLRHEAHHARRRDPLRRLVLRALGGTLFFVPLLASLTRRFEAAVEIDADRAAGQTVAERRTLAAALLVLTQDDERVASERVDALLGRSAPVRVPRGALVLGLSANSVLFGAALALASACAHLAP